MLDALLRALIEAKESDQVTDQVTDQVASLLNVLPAGVALKSSELMRDRPAQWVALSRRGLDS